MTISKDEYLKALLNGRRRYKQWMKDDLEYLCVVAKNMDVFNGGEITSLVRTSASKEGTKFGLEIAIKDYLDITYGKDNANSD